MARTTKRLKLSILVCTIFLVLIGFGDCDDLFRFIPYASPFSRVIHRRVHPFHPIRDHLVPIPIAPPQPTQSKQIVPNLTHTLNAIAFGATSANISIKAVEHQGTSTQSNYQASNDATHTIFEANIQSNYDVFGTQDSHRFESFEFWNVKDKPVLVNGHIGFVPFGHSIFMNGFYNGLKTTSHRARVPNYANVQHELCSRPSATFSEAYKSANCTYILDTFNGVFSSRANFSDNHFSIEHIQYAHRYHEMAIINRIRVERNPNAPNNEEGILVRLIYHNVTDSDDLNIVNIRTTTLANRKITLLEAKTKAVEHSTYQSQPSTMSILYEHVPDAIQLQPKQSSVDLMWITLVQSNSTNIEQMFEYLHANAANLLAQHTQEWHRFWQRNEITVSGDEELSKAMSASLYALASSLPSLNTSRPRSPFYGLSPSGMGLEPERESYKGHSFWDTETWMFPVITLLEPIWSEELLNYRYLMRLAASDLADETGYKGYRYPWESAFTGYDTTIYPEVWIYEQHITADIAHALRQRFFATYDYKWFQNVGCDLAYGTALFWESRVKFNATSKRFDINGVMGPDEYHTNVSNNAFTNVAAALNLHFASFASCICNKLDPIKYPINTNWASMAKRITLLYDRELDYNPQYDGYKLGEQIKQADVALLGYPLYYANIQASTRQRNLLYYANVTDANGPAMAWSMYMIGFLEAVPSAATEEIFRRSFAPYVRRPFYVWSENADGAENGAGNFITGAGGFLQLIIYGYAGIRINSDSLTIEKPSLPPNTNELKLNGISYRQSRLTITITQNEVRVSIDPARDFHILIDGREQAANETTFVFNQYQILTLKPIPDTFLSACDLPADTIDPYNIPQSNEPIDEEDDEHNILYWRRVFKQLNANNWK